MLISNQFNFLQYLARFIPYEVYDKMAMRYMLLHENNNCTYYSEYTRSNIAIITYAPGYNI